MKPDKIESVTPGGIIIPEKEQEQFQRIQQTGFLVELGPLAFDDFEEPWCKVGDHVLFSRYEGDIIEGLDEEDYRIINDKALICLIDPKLKIGELDVRRPYDQ